MDKTTSAPQATLQEAIRYFSDPDVCLTYMVAIRWPDGNVVCPTCGKPEPRFLASRRIWQCGRAHAKRQFSIKTGTIFEDSPLPMEKWLPAVWLIVNAKNGISSYELSRALGVTQKTGWFMLHRIRLAMRDQSNDMLRGRVEADEAFIGGHVRWMHKDRRDRVMQGRKSGHRGTAKAVVVGVLERGGRVRAKVVPEARNPYIRGVIDAHVAPGAEIITDAATSYKTLTPTFVHNFIDHMSGYVRGHVHTNGIESFWALLKRGLRGTYISVEPFHLHRYVDEQAFRFNERHDKDGVRFVKALRHVAGRRIMYKELIGAAGPA